MKKLWSLLGETLKEIPAPFRLALIIMIIYSVSSSAMLVKLVVESRKTTNKYEQKQDLESSRKDAIIEVLKHKVDSLGGRIFEVQTEDKKEEILLLENFIHATQKKK